MWLDRCGILFCVAVAVVGIRRPDEDDDIVLCGDGGDDVYDAGAGICDARLASCGVRCVDPFLLEGESIYDALLFAILLSLSVYERLGVGIPPLVLLLFDDELVRGWGIPEVVLDDAVE